MGQRKTTGHLKNLVLLYSIHVLGKIAKNNCSCLFCSAVNEYILTDRGSKQSAQSSHLLVIFFHIVVVFSGS